MEAVNLGNQNSRNLNSAQQSNATNDPFVEQNVKIEKVVSEKCKRHPQKNAIFLHLMSNVSNPKICAKCVQQDGIPSTNYLDIQEVLLASSDSDLFSYPVLTQPQTRQAIQTHSEILDSDINQFNSFYQEFAKQIEAKIEVNKHNQKLKIGKLGDLYQNSMDCWKQIADIDSLKLILFEENNEQKLIQFINNHLANSETNTRRIKDICDQFYVIKNQFSLENPNQIKTLISSLLEKISFFEGSNKSPISSNDQSVEDRNELQRKQQEVDQLKQQLSDCKSQLKEAQKTIQDQQQLIEELLDQNQNQPKKISNKNPEIKEKQISTSLRDQPGLEEKLTQSSNNQQQHQPIRVKIITDQNNCKQN